MSWFGKGRSRGSISFVHEFQQSAQLALSACQELGSVFAGGSTLNEAVERIGEIEHKGDSIVADVHRLVDATFIAPYDKKDIVSLIDKLDDISDTIWRITRRLVVYRALEAEGSGVLRATAGVFSSQIERSATALKHVIDHMPGFEHEKVREAVRTVIAVEDEADDLLEKALLDLFADPNRPLTAAMLGWREIFQLLERVTDECDHAMKVVLSIARQEGS